MSCLLYFAGADLWSLGRQPTSDFSYVYGGGCQYFQPGPRLLCHPGLRLVLIVPTQGGMARLSWAGCLFTYCDGLPNRRQSPMPIRTGPDVE